MGRLSLYAGFNRIYCWGFGVQYHTITSVYEDLDSLDIIEYIDARVFRLDLILFYINFTLWAKQEWDEN
jgi:hypothetical protein